MSIPPPEAPVVLTPVVEPAGPMVPAESWVRFECQGELFALPLLSVREVIEPGPLGQIPRAPLSAAGVMNHHGRVIPVVDLAALLSGRAASTPSLVLLLDHPHRRLGLAVDTVEGIGPVVVEEDLARVGDRAVTMLSLEVLLEQVDLAFKEGGMLQSQAEPLHREET